MNINQIREKIMADDEFVLCEIDKIVTYYNLKHTVRWAHNRTQDETESVAEHVYGMNILISYFLPLIDIELNVENIRQIAIWHDMAEAVVGDMTSSTKTENHKKAEKDAEKQLVEQAPSHLKNTLKQVYETFDSKSTHESQFVKAIDKIEPMFHMYFLLKKSDHIHEKFDLGWSSDIYREYRKPHINTFPIIDRFDQLLIEKTKKFHP